jgi:trimeric autotransporter adhesin
MKRLVLVCVVVVAALSVTADVTAAAPIYLCINEKAGGGVKSGGAEGKCPLPTEKVKYTKVALPREESEQQTLLSILPHITYVASGVGGKPTIEFSGVNVQIVNGEGKTASVNGEGNLVVGYDENKEGKHEQTGSHNLILGEEQTFTSYGGFLAGFSNSLTAPLASVTGGENNVAAHERDSVSGGDKNEANGIFAAWVGGGRGNRAIGSSASVSGGVGNIASGEFTSASGGNGNVASGTSASVSGGETNRASGAVSSITGGELSESIGQLSSVEGGLKNTVTFEGVFASIFGGKELTAKNSYEAIP